jgi:hypothetical protein
MRKRQENWNRQETGRQNGMTSNGNDNRDADQVIQDSRCALSTILDTQLRTIAKTENLTKCELEEKALGEFVQLKKLQSECIKIQASGINDDRCKYFRKG